MSRALPLPPDHTRQGDCRDDKKRRLHQGHAGGSSSGLPDGDLENLFSSLTMDNILSERTSGDFSKNRKRKSGQEPAGDLLNRLPDDALESMLSSLAIQDAAVTSSVSGRSGKEGSVLIFSDQNIFVEENSDDATSTQCNDPASRSLRADEFIDRVNDWFLRHEGTGVQVLEVHSDLNSTHAAHLDKWVQTASKSDAQSVRLHLCKNGISCAGHSVTASPYNFPLHCLVDGQGSSLQKLCLTNCIFGPLMNSSSFSSLLSLSLARVTITDSIQYILSCFPVLRFLRLGSCNDLVNIRISSEALLHLDISHCEKLESIKIHSTSLVFFEYDGHKLHIKYACAPNMRRIVTKFSNRNCSLSKHLNKMKLIEKVTFTFLSPLKEPNFKLYAKKFPVLKFVNLYILPSWNNVLGVAYLLEATPCVKRLRLEMQACRGEYYNMDNVRVIWPDGISLRQLRAIVVGGFAAQPPLMELLARLVRAATGLKFLQINPHHHLCQGMGKWVRAHGDKVARDHARNAARETIGPQLPLSVKFAVKRPGEIGRPVIEEPR